MNPAADPNSTSASTPPPLAGSLAGLVAGIALGFVLAMQIPDDRFPSPALPDALLQSPRFIERTTDWATALDRAGPNALEPLLERVEGFDPGPQNANLLLFLDWWARFDPEAANEWAVQFEREHELRVRHGVFRAWARSDPKRALGFAKASFRLGGRGDSLQNPNLPAVFLGWDESGLPGLKEWIFETEKIERQILMQHWARQRVAVMEPDAVWEWAEAFPPPLHNEMVPAVAAALAARDPEAALRLATPRIERGDRFGLSQSVATRWMKRDPIAALEWLSLMDDTFARDNAVLEACRSWAGIDEDAFTAYIEQRLEAYPAWLEPGVELYSRLIATNGNPERGLAIASQLSTQARRDYNATKILWFWLIEDRSAASAWIEANDVSDVIRKRVGYPPRAGDERRAENQ